MFRLAGASCLRKIGKVQIIVGLQCFLQRKSGASLMCNLFFVFFIMVKDQIGEMILADLPPSSPLLC